MSQLNSFNWAGYTRWQEPPALHEIDACENCHDDGEHTDEIEHWAKTCGYCEVELEEFIASNTYCLVHHAWFCEELHGQDEALLTRVDKVA